MGRRVAGRMVAGQGDLVVTHVGKGIRWMLPPDEWGLRMTKQMLTAIMKQLQDDADN